MIRQKLFSLATHSPLFISILQKRHSLPVKGFVNSTNPPSKWQKMRPRIHSHPLLLTMRDVDLWLLFEFEVQLEVLVEPLKCLRITASSSEIRLEISTR